MIFRFSYFMRLLYATNDSCRVIQFVISVEISFNEFEVVHERRLFENGIRSD